MTKRILTLFGGAAVLGVLLLGVVGAYIYFTGGDGTASESITENAEQLDAEAPSQTVFRIVQAESSVSFTLQEDLRGVRTTVVGTTNEIAGDIRIDTANPTNSEIGNIRINLRTLATDQDMRNRMIRSEILKSGNAEYEFTEFVPTAITGLPATVTVGQPFTFQVTGDLKLVDTTKPVTFEMTVTPVSTTRLEGTGTATVLRSDYGLKIPNVPSVANVTDEVTLTIDFVATPVTEEEASLS